LRVLYFGTYERNYPRNAQVISALRTAGVEVVEHHEPVYEARRDNWAVRWTVALRLFVAEMRLRYSSHDAFDVVLVGYPGHFDVPHARRVAGKRPLVFNPLISLHDTLVGDRSRYREGRFTARILWVIDRRALRTPDLVVADTEANAEFLAEVGDLPRERVQVCLVGAEDRLFHAGWRPDEPFRVLLLPLLYGPRDAHGIVLIIEDMTDLRHSEAFSAYLGRIVAGLMNEVYILDPDTLRFRMVNDDVVDLYGRVPTGTVVVVSN